jgi:methionyl-tRNA formyltransferase
MRITILANSDLPSNYALNLLVASLSDHDLTIFLSDKVGKRGTRPSGLKNLEFFEQSLFTRLLFPLMNEESPQRFRKESPQRLFKKSPRRFEKESPQRLEKESPDPSHKKSPQLLSFEGLAEKIGKPILVLNAINDGQDLDSLTRSEPDLIVTLRYGVILKSRVIAIPKYGVINLHSGLLPAYKGVMATFRALQASEVTIGTTLHYITDSSIDTGPVIGTTAMDVIPGKSYLWHVLNLYPDGCKLIAASVEMILNKGRLDSVSQEPGGRYYTFPTDDDLNMFEQAGNHLFEVEEILEFASQYMPEHTRP